MKHSVETYLGPSGTSMMKPFVVMVDGFLTVTIFALSSIIDVLQGPKCVFAQYSKLFNLFKFNIETPSNVNNRFRFVKTLPKNAASKEY